MKNLEHKVAVITGGASGFGLAFARVAAARGMKLVLADVHEEGLAAARAELEGKGAEVLVRRTDVSQGAEVEALADAAWSRFGGAHLVFNNAGVAAGGLVWENTEKDWAWILGVNLWGVVHGVRVFTPRMIEASRGSSGYAGHIVNTASMAGVISSPNMGVYNASKHAVVTLTETLYQDLALVGAPIGVSLLCPYFVPTGIHLSDRVRPADLADEGGPTTSQQLAAKMSAKAVTSGKVSAEDVAQRTFEAVEADQFYIFSHPQALAGVRTRMEDILAVRNPSDPFAARPELGETLRATLRAPKG
jgi:NAD(P)-dependent dehydrogenase (short-subunit alcohol dehydrogenase family)